MTKSRRLRHARADGRPVNPLAAAVSRSGSSRCESYRPPRRTRIVPPAWSASDGAAGAVVGVFAVDSVRRSRWPALKTFDVG
jgi:hypothetical protein